MFYIFLHTTFTGKMNRSKLRINYVAVSVAGITAFLQSMLSYSPIFFGGIWELYRNPPNPTMPGWTMTFAPLRELIAAFVIALLIIRIELRDWKSTTRLMLLLWLAFMPRNDRRYLME